MNEIDIDDFRQAHAAGATVVDVRAGFEYVMGHVPGAVLIPLEQLAGRLAEVPAGAVHVICATGNRSKVAADILSRAGREAYSVAGGTSAWELGGGSLVRGRDAG